MKKAFVFGVLAGLIISALVGVSTYAITNRSSKNNMVCTEVQHQVIQNIQDVNNILVFADDNLAKYINNLMEVRGILSNADSKKNIDQEEKKRIDSLCEQGLQIIETAKFNTIPVFHNNCDGEYSRIIPVTLDASDPTYKITITCINFNRNVVNQFIKSLASEKKLENNITELDKIITAVSLERAQLGAYKNRLKYSLEVAEVLLIKNASERQAEISRIIKNIKTEELVLCVQSANGLYCLEDRQQIQVNFNELNNELNRISAISQRNVKEHNNISLLSQESAENAMLYLVKN